MKVDVVATINEIRQEDLIHKTVIVIDALRASSTIITALHQDCKAIKTVETVGQAKQFDNENTLLAGERYCNRIQGFALNNSPTEMLQEASLPFKKLILTTTNGTRAIQKALKADHIFIGCFLNGTASMKSALKMRKDITLLCAGSRDEFALEDGLAAGYMIECLFQQKTEVQLNDLGYAMHLAYLQAEPNLMNVILQTTNSKRLVEKGFMEDIEFCCKKDFIPLVPVYQNEHIIPFQPS